MEDRNRSIESPTRKSPSLWLFLGILPVVSGILAILQSLGILEDIDTHPSKIEVFNNSQRWEVTMIGASMLFFGIGNLLPPGMKFLGRLVAFLFVISFIAVAIGVILERIR
jgi:hypothetical protein